MEMVCVKGIWMLWSRAGVFAARFPAPPRMRCNLIAQRRKMTEDHLEQEALSWLVETGYIARSGPDIAHDGTDPQRSGYTQVILPQRLRDAIARLNPGIPAA